MRLLCLVFGLFLSPIVNAQNAVAVTRRLAKMTEMAAKL
jgi:hypothetical protein